MDDHTLLDLLVDAGSVTLEPTLDGRLRITVGTRYAVVDGLAALAETLTRPGALAPLPDRHPSEPRGLVVKASVDEDLFAIISGVVDNVTMIGTAAALHAEGVSAARLLRAARSGSSAKSSAGYPGEGGWSYDGFLIREQDGSPTGSGDGWLPLSRLSAFLHAKLAGDEVAAGAMLDPLPDDD
jgi:hypothetical protein